MPLFRSKADLSVHLDQSADSLFSPGDVVSGHVVLLSPEDENVSTISISFLGKSKTYMTRHKTAPGNRVRTIYFRDRAPLFTFSTTLFSGPYTLPANREHSWPFQFVFPTNTSEDRRGAYDSSCSLTWLTQPHALPPSFQDQYGMAYATVSYVLQASLDRKHHPVTTDSFLNFSPFRQPSSPKPPLASRQMFSFASSRLRAGREEMRRSLKEALTDRFSSKTPSLEFVVMANSDQVVISGQDIALSLSLRIRRQESTAEIIPSFTIRIRDLALMCYTHCRAMEDSTWPSFRSPEDQRLFESMVPLSHSLEAIATTRSENNIDQPIAITAHIPTSICPSFKSYAINRSYKLMVKVKVETTGKDFEAKFDIPGFTVLSSVVPPPVQEVTIGEAGLPQPSNTGDDRIPEYTQRIDMGDAGPSMRAHDSNLQEPVPAYDVGALPSYGSSEKD